MGNLEQPGGEPTTPEPNQEQGKQEKRGLNTSLADNPALEALRQRMLPPVPAVEAAETSEVLPPLPTVGASENPIPPEELAVQRWDTEGGAPGQEAAAAGAKPSGLERILADSAKKFLADRPGENSESPAEVRARIFAAKELVQSAAPAVET